MKDDFLIKIETWHKPDLGKQENVHGLDPDTWKNVEVVYIDIADRSLVHQRDYKPDEDPSKFKSAKTGRGPLGPDWKKELSQKTDCPHMCAYKLVTIKFKWWGLQNKVENFIQKVHGLDPDTWKNVEVVYIDIADRSLVHQRDYKPDEDPSKFKSAKTGRGPLGPDWKKELSQKTDCPHMCAYKLVTIKFKWWGLQNKVENFIQKQERRLFTNFHRQLFCWIDKWIELTMEDIRRMEDETKKELDEMRVKDPVKGMTATED
ncbi:UNVERIFIED_CONTAM: hypothetical protein FKN15_053547 [Acipenser sinensis]